MKALNLKSALLISLLASTLALSACQEKGPMEKAGEKIDNAVDETGDAIDEAADDVSDGVRDATN